MLKNIVLKQELDEQQIRNEEGQCPLVNPKRVKVTFIQYPIDYIPQQVEIQQKVIHPEIYKHVVKQEEIEEELEKDSDFSEVSSHSTKSLQAIQKTHTFNPNSNQDESTHHTEEGLQTQSENNGKNKSQQKIEQNSHSSTQYLSVLKNEGSYDIPEKKNTEESNSKGSKRKYTINPNRVYKNFKGKVFNCTNESCDFQTQNRTSYYNHIKHSHQTEVVFQCDQCPYKSMNKRNLNQHVSYCHLDTVLNCPICQKQNLNKYSLKKHMKEVHCEKSYKCDLCPDERMFKSKSSLNKHKLNVHSEGIFCCQQCSYSTKCQQYLNEHIRNRHQQNQYPNEALQIQQQPQQMQIHNIIPQIHVLPPQSLSQCLVLN